MTEGMHALVGAYANMLWHVIARKSMHICLICLTLELL